MKNFTDEAEALIVKMFNSYNELSKKTYDYYGGIELYPSEVHTIEYIGINGATKLTDVSKELLLTKGAVSKIIVKLEKKGLIKRFRYLDNQKEVYLHLSELGNMIFQGHKDYHSKMLKNINATYEGTSLQEREAILRFLNCYLEQLQLLKEDKNLK